MRRSKLRQSMDETMQWPSGQRNVPYDTCWQFATCSFLAVSVMIFGTYGQVLAYP